jgi:hypothetical protein
MNILSTACPQQWRAACAAARAAGQPEPSWFSWVTAAHARPVQTALSDDIDSLTNGDGSLWQV